jgi:hypothetical protein
VVTVAVLEFVVVVVVAVCVEVSVMVLTRGFRGPVLGDAGLESPRALTKLQLKVYVCVGSSPRTTTHLPGLRPSAPPGLAVHLKPPTGTAPPVTIASLGISSTTLPLSPTKAVGLCVIRG